jgi:hypothetical protein
MKLYSIGTIKNNIINFKSLSLFQRLTNFLINIKNLFTKTNDNKFFYKQEEIKFHKELEKRKNQFPFIY